MSNLTNKNSSILFFAVIAFYIVLRLWNLTGNDLWYDEVFTVMNIRLGWGEMIKSIIQDGVHPPLFYLLLKFWSLASDSVWWLQLFPFFISILTLVPFYLLCREIDLTFLEMSATLVITAINSFFLEYALDLRMYGLFQFFTLFSLWLFVKLLKYGESKQTNTIWLLSLFNLLLVHTHYFGWLIVGLEGLYLIFCQRRLFNKYAIHCFGLLVCFLPWAFLVLQNIVNSGATGTLNWINRPFVIDIMGFYAMLNGNLQIRYTTSINFFIFSLPIFLFLWRMRGQKVNNLNWKVIAFFAVMPIITIFILSHLLPKSIWETRYLIMSAIPYYILVTKSLFDISNKLLRFIFIGLIMSWSLVAGLNNFLQTPKKIQWSKVVEKIKETNVSSNRMNSIFVFENWVEKPLQFYLNEANFSAQVEKRKGLNEIAGENFWVAYRIPISENEFGLRKKLEIRKCNIAQENSISDLSQKVVLYKIDNCIGD